MATIAREFASERSWVGITSIWNWQVANRPEFYYVRGDPRGKETKSWPTNFCDD